MRQRTALLRKLKEVRRLDSQPSAELLKEAIPRITRVALLVNHDWPTPLYQAVVTKADADAGRLGLRLQVLRARDPGDLLPHSRRWPGTTPRH
jgi:hypothetical protein